MLSVLDLLMNHSYLAGQMKSAMRQEGKEMPPEVRELLKTVKGMNAPQRHGEHPHTCAPIP